MLLDRCPARYVGVLWPNGWMDQDATWYGGRRRGPGNNVLDGDPAPIAERGTAAAPPKFRPMSIVAKGSSISAIAKLSLHNLIQIQSTWCTLKHMSLCNNCIITYAIVGTTNSRMVTMTMTLTITADMLTRLLGQRWTSIWKTRKPSY